MRASDWPWLGLLAFLTAGCQDTFQIGTEKGPCYRNRTCNSGLVCLSELCVRLPEGGVPFDARQQERRPDQGRPDQFPGQPPGPMPPGPRPDGFFQPRPDGGKKPWRDIAPDQPNVAADAALPG